MRILLVHPDKLFQPSLANCLSLELQAIAKLLIGHEVVMHDDVHSLAMKLEWCDSILCFGFNCNTLGLTGKTTLNKIVNSGRPIDFVSGDPDYWGISKAVADLPQCTGKLYHPIVNAGGAEALPISHHSCKPVELKCLPFWHMMFASPYFSKDGNPIGTKTLCYIGHARSEHRQNRLMHFMDSNRFHSVTYSVKLSKKVVKHINFKQCYANQALYLMRANGANLVVGDESYNLLMPFAHRVLQGWASNTPTFIDNQLTDELPGVVSDSDELASYLINQAWLDDLLKAQRQALSQTVARQLAEFIAKPTL